MESTQEDEDARRWRPFVDTFLSLVPESETRWTRSGKCPSAGTRRQTATLQEEHRPDDAEEAHGFVASGILHDVTSNRTGLERLLPWMGPRTVEAARGEVAYHAHSRQWSTDDVDWSRAGDQYVAITGLDAEAIRPVD